MGGKAAYQGVPGAFSYEACRAFLPDHEPQSFYSFEDAIAAVKSGACERAVLPVSNSTVGSVEAVALLLPASGLRILEEHELPIHLNLMAKAGASIEALKSARSHPVALGQCHGFLRQHGLKPEPVFDTAGAARDLSQSDEDHYAAVASRAAAELYGLSILAENIEDDPSNRTRFAIVAR